MIGWSDSLYSEERPGGVHVGLVLPGFIATEGFPATELRQKAVTRWIVSKPEKVAEAIVAAGPGGRAERYVPRPYALAAVARILVPGLVRRVLSGGAAETLTTSTADESGDADEGAGAGPT
jgi:short-subunit dehydrogenase